ncbi:cobalt-precorrin-6A reductase [Hassallia byssoidea VB512170]|uniref:Cobalt-precorrin-6A reductase n=1 Tax=Hassallia byssoidea VB512170 TaxID=1304833 RepID=A0A846H8W7_9CYAN|nr:cobalt-precorrin-6A reductase [Hassalia byssoidea]NEU73782.1 cobalt-precorrin-6A reductase [Hassalia byssoidea VB512170]
MKRVLILGGTGDAAELAAKAANLPGIEVMVSLAGRTRQPKDVAGNVRIGGFGGVAGLTAYLRDEAIDLLVDATHPFAAQISLNAIASATEVNIPALMLVRPMWQRVMGDNWIEVESIEAAALKLSDRPKRVFLTIGRQELAAFAHIEDIWFLMRMIDPPQPNTLVPKGLLLYDRGPFTLASERQLLIQHAIDTIVSKNSGGDATYAKIIAARELNIPVVMVQRPAVLQGDRVTNVEAALNWLISHLK